MAVIRIPEIQDSDHAALAARAIGETLDGLGKRVFTKQDLLDLIAEHRDEWRIPDRIPPKMILDRLLTASPLKRIVLRGPAHSQEFPRYLWRDAHAIEVAASLRFPKSYLCHSSALFAHGLVDDVPQDICVNYEQSPKAKPTGEVTQASLTRAFQGKQRHSAFTFRYKKHVIVVLSGKSTGGLEVQSLSIGTGAKVRVTGLERTLIDVTVRPTYAEGVENVLRAFRRAKDRISIDKIISTLQKLDYVYPYHQAVGFYLERAGYPKHLLVGLKGMGLDLDFYLAHGMQDTAYEPPRDCRRLQHLRRWSHDEREGKEIFARGPGAGGADGDRACRGASVAMGGGLFGGIEDRM